MKVFCGARGVLVELGEGVKLALRLGLAHLGELNVFCCAHGLLVKLGEGVKPAPIKRFEGYLSTCELM